MKRRDGTDIPAEAWAELFPVSRTELDIGGCTVVRPSIPIRPLTVIVLGAFRGGTSYVAEKLIECGVPLGDAYSEVTPVANYVSYEDAELAWPLDPLAGNFNDNQAEYLDLLKLLILERDAKYELWGFKKPSAVFIIDKILALFRNPHIIAIVRDPLASHQSGRAHGVVESGRLSISDCRAHFAAVMDVVDRPRCPTLAMSYERTKGKPGQVRDAIREFLDL